MARPHTAARIEDAYHDRLVRRLTARGWGMRIVPFTGYGSLSSARVLARVLMSRDGGPDAEQEHTHDERMRRTDEENRGWRAFVSSPLADEEVVVRVGAARVTTRSDRGGLIDLEVTGHGLGAGWQRGELSSAKAGTVQVPIRIVDDAPTLGIISDVDDTVLSTTLPRPLVAAWNTFVKTEGARHPVPGMPALFTRLLLRQPDAPVFYVSTGAWNTAPGLTRFLRRRGYPPGPMLLTDWGPTNSGWFRSGVEHKRSALRRLARDLPNVRWLLIGDDGQHDASLYAEFATEFPDRVQAIAIRQLTPGQQVLAHGLPMPEEGEPGPPPGVPFVRASNGFALSERISESWPASGGTGRGADDAGAGPAWDERVWE